MTANDWWRFEFPGDVPTCAATRYLFVPDAYTRSTLFLSHISLAAHQLKRRETISASFSMHTHNGA